MFISTPTNFTAIWYKEWKWTKRKAEETTDEEGTHFPKMASGVVSDLAETEQFILKCLQQEVNQFAPWVPENLGFGGTGYSRSSYKKQGWKNCLKSCTKKSKTLIQPPHPPPSLSSHILLGDSATTGIDGGCVCDF